MASEAADTIALEIEPDVDVQPRTPAVAAGFFDADAGAASEPHVLARDPVHVREHGAPGETASGDVLPRCPQSVVAPHRPGHAEVVVAGDAVEPATVWHRIGHVDARHVCLGSGVKRIQALVQPLPRIRPALDNE